jgi:hypothetical protein
MLGGVPRTGRPARCSAGRSRSAAASWLYTVLSVFAAPLDVTMSELAIELFFAADADTERALRDLCAAPAEVRR